MSLVKQTCCVSVANIEQERPILIHEMTLEAAKSVCVESTTFWLIIFLNSIFTESLVFEPA